MDNTRLYVRNLHYDVRWYDLKRLMRPLGEVLHAKVLMGSDGRSQGCGIVEFARPEDAQRAIETMNGTELMGRPIQIYENREFHPPKDSESFNSIKIPTHTAAQAAELELTGVLSSEPPRPFSIPPSSPPPNAPKQPAAHGLLPPPYGCADVNIALNPIGGPLGPVGGPAPSTGSLGGSFSGSYGIGGQAGSSGSAHSQPVHSEGTAVFVSNLPFGVSWMQLRQLFSTVGPVLRADIHMTPQRRSRGHGTVIFADEHSAKRAIKRFNNYTLDGRVIEVREDKPASERPAAFLWCSSRGDPSDVVFVSNLPWSTRDNDLVELFQTIAPLTRAQLQNFPDGRFSGCGVVRYDSHTAAIIAISKLNNYGYGGRKLSVSFARYPPGPS